MKIIFTTFLILLSALIFGQKVDLVKRLDYLKEHHLFVVNIEFDCKRMNQLEKDSINRLEIILNNNIKKCIQHFWNLSDSIIYINLESLKEYKKKYPKDIFLNYNRKYFDLVYLEIPKNRKLLKDVSPRVITSDTSLLGVTKELRQLQYNVILGSNVNRGIDTPKIILILDEPAANEYHQQFIEDIKLRFPDNYMIVNRQFVTKAVYSQDIRFVYINSLSIINTADGSLIPF